MKNVDGDRFSKNRLSRQPLLQVTPSLYAVSWIMTAFAAQLPFGISVRIMDFIFLQGIDALFKVKSPYLIRKMFHRYFS